MDAAQELDSTMIQIGEREKRWKDAICEYMDGVFLSAKEESEQLCAEFGGPTFVCANCSVNKPQTVFGGMIQWLNETEYNYVGTRAHLSEIRARAQSETIEWRDVERLYRRPGWNMTIWRNGITWAKA